MNNTINNTSISFQANIVTKLKGRNGVMKEIEKEFSRISQKTPGTLVIQRTPMRFMNEDHHNLYTQVDGICTLANGLRDVLEKNPNKLTKKDIKESARRLYTNFLVLSAESKFYTDTKAIKTELAKIDYENTLREKCVKNPKNASKRIQLLENKKQALMEKFYKLKERYLSYLNKNIDKGYNLDIYAQMTDLITSTSNLML